MLKTDSDYLTMCNCLNSKVIGMIYEINLCVETFRISQPTSSMIVSFRLHRIYLVYCIVQHGNLPVFQANEPVAIPESTVYHYTRWAPFMDPKYDPGSVCSRLLHSSLITAGMGLVYLSNISTSATVYKLL